MQYKMDMLECVRARMDRTRAAGSHVVIVGDFNISPQPADHCDPGPDFCTARRDRRWMSALLTVPATPRVEGILAEEEPAPIAFEGGFVDTFRARHPDRRGAFTCWNTASGARNHNWGTRIDLVLVAEPTVPARAASGAIRSSSAEDEGALEAHFGGWTWEDAIVAADIAPETRGSDHAPAWIDVDDARLPKRCKATDFPPPQAAATLLAAHGRQQRLQRLWTSASQARSAESGAGAFPPA